MNTKNCMPMLATCSSVSAASNLASPGAGCHSPAPAASRAASTTARTTASNPTPISSGQ